MNERQTPADQNTPTADTTNRAPGTTSGAAVQTSESVRDTTSARDTQATDIRDDDAGFLPAERMSALRERWNDVQAGFVDDPRSAVQNAQQLVGEIVSELTEMFTRERSTLEGQWSSGGQADTEALRIALQRYRSFFNRLLAT